MAHPLISTIVIALALAWVFGSAAHRLRLPPLVGYLLAGVLIGPSTPGFVADQALAQRARRDRRHPADVRRRPAFLARTAALGAGDRRARRHRADRLRHAARHGAWPLARLVDRRRPRLRPGAVGGEHRGSAARPAGAAAGRDRARPHRRRLAHRRRHGDGADARAPAGLRRRARRRRRERSHGSCRRCHRPPR